VIGVISEDILVTLDAGAVNVLYGSDGVGLSSAGNQLWSQNSSSVLGVAESGDAFGSSVAAGDYNGDGYDDLAVGVNGEDLSTSAEAGAIHVLYGSSGPGLTSSGNQLWHQDISGIQSVAESDEWFGDALATGDFDGDGYDDLAVGVPAEDISFENAGAVSVLYGSGSGSSPLTAPSVEHTIINPFENQIPAEFRLEQNYPNPFNPTTTIHYSLPQNAAVQLRVYDVLGREVRTLVDESRGAGYQSVVWDGMNNDGQSVASGVYFYRIAAGDPSSTTGAWFVQSQKMVLSK
jgi:hypothetical protein